VKLSKRIEKYAARAIAKLPTAMAKRIAGPVEVDGQTLDPHLRMILAANKRNGGFETFGSVAGARDAYRHIASVLEKPEAPAKETRDQGVETGECVVPIRIYRPDASGARPAVVYFHGGGYTIGDLQTHDGLCRRFSRELGAVVIAVDYRLAPEHPFPAGVNDCVAVTRWVVQSTEALGIDASRIALAGDSAGGNFAAVVSQEVEGIAFQLLIYPGTDARVHTRSKDLFAEGFGLDKTTIDWFFATYADGASRDEPRISPAASLHLAKSPPTHVATAGFDVLRDEGLAFAAKLQSAGVACTVETHTTLGHGFVHLTRLPGCDAGVAKLVDALRDGLA
jgi:acetyl esterase